MNSRDTQGLGLWIHSRDTEGLGLWEYSGAGSLGLVAGRSGRDPARSSGLAHTEGGEQVGVLLSYQPGGRLINRRKRLS